MLEMKEACESCACALAHDQSVYICSYEHSFCARCVRGPVGRICPHCHGELTRRPRRTDGDGPRFIDQVRTQAKGEIPVE